MKDYSTWMKKMADQVDSYLLGEAWKQVNKGKITKKVSGLELSLSKKCSFTKPFDFLEFDRRTLILWQSIDKLS